MLPDQQQFGDQDGELLTGQPRVSGSGSPAKNSHDYVIKSTMSIAAGQTPVRSVSPTRRTSAPRKRGDDTRAKIIDETVRCIVEEGFAAATAKHVAERAGVTWGVIQYHFGDRNGLLMAVVDDGVARLVDSLSSADVSELAVARAHRGRRRHRVELLQQSDLDGGLRNPAGHPRRPRARPRGATCSR